VRRRDLLERERRQQREAGHHAERHDGQRDHIPARRSSLTKRQEKGRAEQCGDHRAHRREEQRREVGDGNARGRQRPAEDDDAQEAAAPAGRCSFHALSVFPSRCNSRGRPARTETVAYNLDNLYGLHCPYR